MSFPYVVVSDIHCHSWSQFSKTNADGVNSRLAVILEELLRAAETVKAAGGTMMRVAGDLFHVRGKIEPTVFNPTFDTFRKISDMGITVELIPGNHDLESYHAVRLGNAMQQLEQIAGVTVIVEPEARDETVMVPWIDDLGELRRVCKKLANKDLDLIIHAPLNGVIKGLPDLGLDPDDLASWGYDRVFVGHYHNHKEFAAGKVYSIGATTHQTWSDPGTAAGFLMVYKDRIEFHESEAPEFVNIDDEADINPLSVGGNYVRLRLQDMEEKALNRAKKELEKCGAWNWVDHSSKKRDSVRPDGAAVGNVTLEVSIANYVLKHLDAGGLDKRRIATDALEVLRDARTVGAE